MTEKPLPVTVARRERAPSLQGRIHGESQAVASQARTSTDQQNPSNPTNSPAITGTLLNITGPPRADAEPSRTYSRRVTGSSFSGMHKHRPAKPIKPHELSSNDWHANECDRRPQGAGAEPTGMYSRRVTGISVPVMHKH